MTCETGSRPSHNVTAAVWTGFAMMCIGMFMAILDVQVVATSLAAIQTALHIAQDQMSWIQTAYLIAEIISIPLSRFADDRRARRCSICETRAEDRNLRLLNRNARLFPFLSPDNTSWLPGLRSSSCFP